MGFDLLGAYGCLPSVYHVIYPISILIVAILLAGVTTHVPPAGAALQDAGERVNPGCISVTATWVLSNRCSYHFHPLIGLLIDQCWMCTGIDFFGLLALWVAPIALHALVG